MSVRISRILHAGYVFECGGTRILFDPIFENPFSQNCYAYPAVRFDQAEIKKQKFDAVIISHYHDDHCSFESLALLDRRTPIYLFCVHEEMFALLKKLGFVQVHALELRQMVTIGKFQITAHQALDADVDSILEVVIEDLHILNIVDSWIDPTTLKKLCETSWDLILWPFQTMRELEVIAPAQALPATGKIPEEWIEQFKKLRPRYLVPSSCQFIFEEWSWLNTVFFPISYAGFAQQLRQILPETQMVRMNPGTSFELNQQSLQSTSRLSWVVPVGEQDVDYTYQEATVIPATAEIAKQLKALSPAEASAVFQYCENEIIKRYTQLPESEDPFFAMPRKWQLNIYDEQGRKKSFRYLLANGVMRQDNEDQEESQEAWDWLTEIPLCKLFAAVFQGESLSSLYLRIENVDKYADIVEDPLLRCLFSNSLGSYQKAQLKRICRVE